GDHQDGERQQRDPAGEHRSHGVPPNPDRVSWHACCADWNCGEFWSTPGGSCIVTPPPEKSGSGKRGTPFLRMHFAYSRTCACSPLLCAPPACPPCGARSWHAFCAALNSAELGSMSLPGPAPSVSWPFSGSGNSGTPFSRMHSE